MSGIVAAAQAGGCCCRPQGCVCSDPNRPGAVFDRQLTSLVVVGEMTVDERRLDNGGPAGGEKCECPCSPDDIIFGTGAITYGYRSPGRIVDPENTLPGDPCFPGCTAFGCGGCPTYGVSANTGEMVCEQVEFGTLLWQSRNRIFGQNMVGGWNWSGRRVGHCVAPDGIVRVRTCCRFIEFGYPIGYGDLIVDPCGAFVNSEGQYGSTPYGDTLGTIHAVQYANVFAPPLFGPNNCRYRLGIGIGYMFTHSVLEQLAIDGFYYPTVGIGASYSKPCLSPTDTVLGTYTLDYVPDYDYYFEDPGCGRIRWYKELRTSFPNTVEVQ